MTADRIALLAALDFANGLEGEMRRLRDVNQRLRDDNCRLLVKLQRAHRMTDPSGPVKSDEPVGECDMAEAAPESDEP